MTKKVKTNCSSCNKEMRSRSLSNKLPICFSCKKENSIKNCKFCNKETKNAKFCSKSCSAKYNNKIPKRKLSKKCSNCDLIVRNYKSKLCENHYQEQIINKKENILNSTIKDYTEKDSILKLHPSSKFSAIRGLCRSWNKDKLKLPCHSCGYSKHVELAHIKPLSSFSPDSLLKEVNSPDNIIQLCPNCHWEFDNGFLVL